MFNVTESLNFLKLEGLPVAKTVSVDSVNDLKMACDLIGYPLVMKLNTSEHKTDKGGVIIDLKNYEMALKAFKKLSSINKQLVIQHQVEGLELSLGVKQDPVFGPIIMFGLGGVFIEVLKDVSFRVCPVTKQEAKSMINELRSNQLLKGYRGQPGVNIDLLAELIVKLSKVAVNNDIKVLDINPLFATKKGFLIVDARLEINS